MGLCQIKRFCKAKEINRGKRHSKELEKFYQVLMELFYVLGLKSHLIVLFVVFINFVLSFKYFPMNKLIF